MKKITFILLGLISGTAIAQSASADGTAQAQIVSAIEITAGDHLIFGNITPNAGIVVVTPGGFDAGSTTATVIAGPSPSPASFTVKAAESQNYSVKLPGTVNLEIDETGVTMLLNDLKHNSNGSQEVFNVGGTLNVVDGQAEGLYRGTVTVSVAYE